MLHDQLGMAVEQIRQAGRPRLGLENIIGLDLYPRQIAARLGDGVPFPGQGLFPRQQVLAGGQPVFP